MVSSLFFARKVILIKIERKTELIMCLCASKAAVIIIQAVCCFCQILNGSIENGQGDDDFCFCVHVEVDTGCNAGVSCSPSLLTTDLVSASKGQPNAQKVIELTLARTRLREPVAADVGLMALAHWD